MAFCIGSTLWWPLNLIARSDFIKKASNKPWIQRRRINKLPIFFDESYVINKAINDDADALEIALKESSDLESALH